MFCPKCGDLELEPVNKDKIEYLACINGCEGVWIQKTTVEKCWGKKKLKTIESELVEIKQQAFEDKINLDDDIAFNDLEEEFDDEEDDSLDFEDKEDGLEKKKKEEEKEEKEEEEEEEIEDDAALYDFDDDEEDEEEVEEVNFSDQRGLKISSFITEDGEYDESNADAGDNFSETSDLMDEEDDESIEVNEEETFFLSSPVSGNPMKRYSYNMNSKTKCMIGECADSDCFWIDGSDEILSLVIDKNKTPKTFAEFLAYDRPEEEFFEEEDEDDEL